MAHVALGSSTDIPAWNPKKRLISDFAYYKNDVMLLESQFLGAVEERVDEMARFHLREHDYSTEKFTVTLSPSDIQLLSNQVIQVIKKTGSTKADPAEIVSAYNQTIPSVTFDIDPKGPNEIPAWSDEIFSNFKKSFLNKFGITADEIPTECIKWGCYKFALYSSGVPVDKLSKITEYELSEAFKFITDFGFVQTEAPKSGDLILFSQNKSSTHLGIYKTDGNVYSKPDRDTEFALTEPLADVVSMYGDEITYFTPKSASVAESLEHKEE